MTLVLILRMPVIRRGVDFMVDAHYFMPVGRGVAFRWAVVYVGDGRYGDNRWLLPPGAVPYQTGVLPFICPAHSFTSRHVGPWPGRR